MIITKEIEREIRENLDRMHHDVSDLPGPREGADPWLNSTATVERIVLSFAVELFRRLHDAPGTVMQWLDWECARLNRIFIGETLPEGARFSRGPWNTPDLLGASILLRFKIEGETHTGVRDAFMLLASHLVDVLEGADVRGEAATRADVDLQVRMMRNALLGLDDDAIGVAR